MRAAATRLKCEGLVRRAISVSSVYFSIALNSVIMRRRWLHYQRRVIGPFHQLLATHCANHRSASLTINRCDLVIKQGDGEKHARAFIFIYFSGACSRETSRAADMRLLFIRLLECIQLCVMLKKVCLRFPDKCEQILKRKPAPSDVFMATGVCLLNVHKYSGERLAAYLIYISTVCVCVSAFLSVCVLIILSHQPSLSISLVNQLPLQREKEKEKASVPPLRLLWFTSSIGSGPFMSPLNTPSFSFINTDLWKKKKTHA